MRDSYYSSPISKFLRTSNDEILGELTRAHHHALEHQQRNAWLVQIDFLKAEFSDNPGGHLFFEFSIPRMGKRADVVLVRGGIIFVIEFKVNSATFDGYAIDQVHDYSSQLCRACVSLFNRVHLF